MKICEIVRLYGTHNRFGGMPIKSQIFSEALVAQGHEVTVLTTSLGKQDSTMLGEVNGVKIYYLSVPSMQYSDAWWTESNKKFQELHSEIGFDILHSESYSGYQIETDIPKFATLHGTGFGLVETYSLMRALGYRVDIQRALGDYVCEVERYKNFDKLIAVSKKEQRILKQKYFHKKVELLYNPINEIFFNKQWQGDGDYYFCYGICCPEKGQKQLNELAKKIKILFAGNINPGGKVIYMGELSQEEIAEHLVRCKGFINPTLYSKGFDLTTCEALAVGTPVFCSYIQVDEDLKDMENCVFIDPIDVNLYRRIIGISEDYDFCKNLSKNAKFYAADTFHPKKVVSRFLTLIGE